MTRQEHLDWCKQRALEYIDRGDVVNGITSMCSDLEKHDETRGHKGIQIGIMMLMLPGKSSDIAWARHFINGFN